MNQQSPPTNVPPVANLSRLRSEGEMPLRTACLVATVVLYVLLLVLTLGLGLLYVGFFMLFSYVGLAVLLAGIRANAVKVSATQLPEVYQSACRAARLLGLAQVPEVYVVQAGGVLNAFATKFALRGWVVVYSDLVDACEGDAELLDMIVAHEMGHLALGHIRWMWILLPARMVPFLSQAYSRACEYSADRCGRAACTTAETAQRGLLILAAGGQCGRMANLEAVIRQRHALGGFWQTVMEWFSTHPWVTRRVEALAKASAAGRD